MYRSNKETWRDIPGHVGFETCAVVVDPTLNGGKPEIFVRNKKRGGHSVRENGEFFVLYKKAKLYYWHEGELGTPEQIERFYKTGEVG